MHFKINEIKIGGFAVSSAKPGEIVRVEVKGSATSEMPRFYIYAEQISNIVFSKINTPDLYDAINQYLIVIHPDNSADFYLQDFEILASIKPNRDVKAGEAIYAKDIIDIKEITFPGININSNDQVVYLKRSGWRFGIYFDLRRKLDIAVLGEEIAELHGKLVLEDILKKVLNEFRQKEENILSTTLPCDAFIIAEGKTDLMHFKKAFLKNGYHQNIEYSESHDDLGDIGLMEICRRAIHLPLNNIPIICVFDRDNPAIIKLLTKKQPDGSKKSYQSWGNNVYSMMIPIPEDRKEYEYISIEMYYSDEIIKRTLPDGKRLYFNNELKRETFPGNQYRLTPIHPVQKIEFSKKIFDENVDKIEDEKGNKLGLSKTVFAELVSRDIEPFNNIDFKNFNLISDIFNKIIEDSQLPRKSSM